MLKSLRDRRIFEIADFLSFAKNRIFRAEYMIFPIPIQEESGKKREFAPQKHLPNHEFSPICRVLRIQTYYYSSEKIPDPIFEPEAQTRRSAFLGALSGFRPDFGKVEQGLYGLFHAVNGHPFQGAVKVVSPGVNIGSGQSEFG